MNAALRFLGALLFAFTALIARGQIDFEQLIAPHRSSLTAEADGLAKEGSWARAATKYRELLTKQTGSAEARWIKLLALEADFKAEGNYRDWRIQSAARLRRGSTLKEWLEPYEKGTLPRDDFWLAARVCAMETVEFRSNISNPTWSAIAAYLEEQVGNERNTKLLHRHLMGGLASLYWLNFGTSGLPQETIQQCVLHSATLDALVSSPFLDRDDRAEAALARLLLQPNPADVEAPAWMQLETLTKGTAFELSFQALDLHREVLLSKGTVTNPKPWEEKAALLVAKVGTEPKNFLQKIIWSQLKADHQSWVQPQLVVRAPKKLGVGKELKFVYGFCNYDRVELTLVEAPLEAAYEVLRHATREEQATNAFKIGKVLRTEIVQPTTKDSLEWVSGVLTPVICSKPAFVFAIARAFSKDQEVTQLEQVIVAPAEMTIIENQRGDFTLQTFDPESRLPMKNAKVRFAFPQARSEPKEKSAGPLQTNNNAVFAEAFTDEVGGLHLEKPQSDRGLYNDFIAEVDGHPFFTNLRTYFGETDTLDADLFFDRQIYKPSETVQWKLLLRKTLPTHEAVGKGKVTVNLVRKEEVVASEEKTLSDNGTTDGKFELEAGLAPGPLTIQLIYENQRLRSDSIEVAHFITPPATLETAWGTEDAHLGGVVGINAEVRYSTGEPVEGAEVMVELNAVGVSFDSANRGNESAMAKWSTALREHPLKGTTDKLGRFHVQQSIPGTFGPIYLHAKITALPPGAQELTSSLAMSVNQNGVVLKNEGNAAHGILATPGTATPIEFHLERCSKQPFTGQVAVRAVETKWKEIWMNENGTTSTERPAEIPGDMEVTASTTYEKGWSLVYAGYAPQEKFRTMASVKDGRLAIELPPLPMGRYEIEVFKNRMPIAKAEDFRRPNTQKTAPAAVMYCVAPGQEILALAPTENALAVANTHLEKGQLHLLAVVSKHNEPHPIVISGTEFFKTIPLPFGPGTARIHFVDTPLPENALSNYRVTLVEHSSYAPFRPTQSSFEIPSDKQPEPFQLIMPQMPARPGSTVTLSGRLNGADFPPQASELSLAAAEDSLGYPGDIDRNQERLGVINQLTQFWVVAHAPNSEPEIEVKEIFDNRFGINRSAYGVEDGDTVELSPFSVDSSSDVGYAATSSLAGTMLDVSGAAPGAFSFGERAKKPDGMVAANRKGSPSPTEPLKEATLRTHFISTAYWNPNVKLAADGSFSVSLKVPDNLTRWRVSAFAVGEKARRTWDASGTFETTLPVMARLETPRFLIEGDSVALETQVLASDADTLSISRSLKASSEFSSVAPNELPPAILAKGETLFHGFEVVASKPGIGTLEFSAKGTIESDAMSLTVPIHEDRISETILSNATLSTKEKRVRLALQAPKDYRAEGTTVTLSLNASEMGSMVAALPYLIDYPYGCVEQTMSRWLPALAVQKTCEAMGIARQDFEDALLAQRGSGLEIDAITHQSLERLEKAQLQTGGFGWWPGATTEDLWMTAYVAFGLSEAKELGVEIPSDLLQDVERSLVVALSEPSESAERNTQAWALFALMRCGQRSDNQKAVCEKVFERLYSEREVLHPTGRACLLYSAHQLKRAQQEEVLLRNLENGLVATEEDGVGHLAHWTGSTLWDPMDSPVEATALTLLVLSSVKPEHPLRTPAEHWLTLNRKADRWSNTRHTALAVLALSDSYRGRKIASSEVSVDVRVNGTKVNDKPLIVKDPLKGDLLVTLPPNHLRPGSNLIEIVRNEGTGPVFAGLKAIVSTSAHEVKEKGHLLSTSRALVRRQKVLSTTGAPLPSSSSDITGSANQGTLVDVVVHLKADHDYPYLKLEIPRPAGCEPTTLVSGWNAFLSAIGSEAGSSHGSPLYVEDHDDRSVIFLPALPAGDWTITLPFRAVFVGDFRALPVQIEAMYAPEISAQSTSTRLKIER